MAKASPFLSTPFGDSAGYLGVVDLLGKKRRLSWRFCRRAGFGNGIEAGKPALSSGAAAGPGTGRLHLQNYAGRKSRLCYGTTRRNSMVQDVSRGGELLVSRDVYRQEVVGRIDPGTAGAQPELAGRFYASDPSDDARTIVLSLQGEAAGSGYEVYIRSTGANELSPGLGVVWPLCLQMESGCGGIP